MDSKIWKNSAFVSSNSIFLVSRLFLPTRKSAYIPVCFLPRAEKWERENRIKRKNKGGRISTSISLRNRWIIHGEPISIPNNESFFFLLFIYLFFCFDSTEKWALNFPSAQFMHVAIVSLIDDKTQPRSGCRFFGRVNRGQGWSLKSGWKSWRHLLTLHLGQFRETEREREKREGFWKVLWNFFCLFFLFFFFSLRKMFNAVSLSI